MTVFTDVSFSPTTELSTLNALLWGVLGTGDWVSSSSFVSTGFYQSSFKENNTRPRLQIIAMAR